MNNILSFYPLTIEHAKYLTCVWADKNVIKYTDIHTPCSINQINDIVDYLKLHDVFIVKNKTTIIGIMGCPVINKDKNEFSIFYHFCRACWNHGYATFSLEWLIMYMKRKYSSFTLTADTIAENIASEKLLLKNNFTMISEEPYECDGISSVKRRYTFKHNEI